MNSWAIARRAFGTEAGPGVIVPNPCGAHARIHDPAPAPAFHHGSLVCPRGTEAGSYDPAPSRGQPVPATDGRLFGTVSGAPRPGNSHAGPMRERSCTRRTGPERGKDRDQDNEYDMGRVLHATTVTGWDEDSGASGSLRGALRRSGLAGRAVECKERGIRNPQRPPAAGCPRLAARDPRSGARTTKSARGLESFDLLSGVPRVHCSIALPPGHIPAGG